MQLFKNKMAQEKVQPRDLNFIRFKSPAVEQAYREHFLKGDKNRAFLIFFLTAVCSLLFIFLDTRPATEGQLAEHAIIRGVFILTTVVLAAAVALDRRPQHFDLLVFLFSLSLCAIQFIFHMALPVSSAAPLINNLLLIIVFYLVLTSRWFLQTFPAILLTIESIALILPQTPADRTLIVIGLVAANLVGCLTALQFHKNRRLQFALWKDSIETKERLASSEAQFRMLFFQSPLGLIQIDTEGTVVACNDAFAQLVDTPREELIGRSVFTEFSHPEIVGILRKAIRGRKGLYEGDHTTHKAGKSLVVRLLARPLSTVDNTRTDVLVTIEDITRRKQAEASLLESEQKYRTVVENVNVGMLVAQDTGLVFVNNTIAEFLGYTPAELVSMPNPFEFIHPADRDMVFERHVQRIENPDGPPDIYTFRVITRDGDVNWVEVTGMRLDWQGRPATLNFFMDITERKLAFDKLEELNTIINRSPVVVFLWANTEDWPVEFVTDNVSDVFGYTPEDFITGRILYADLIHPDDLQRVRADSALFDRENNRKEFIHEPYRVITKNGAVRWLEDRTFFRKDQQGRITHHQGIVSDITARRLAEEALEESRKTLDSILSASPVGICLLENRVIKWANIAFESMFGLKSAEEYRDKGTNMLYATEEEYLRVGNNVYARIVSDRPVEEDVLLKRKDGSVFNGHIKMRCQNPANPLEKAIVTISDISWRVQSETERIKKEKLQGVIETAGAVCHELNQPLQSITGYSQLLTMGLAKDDPLLNKISKIEVQVNRMAAITKKLMRITRYETIGYLDKKIIDIAKAAD